MHLYALPIAVLIFIAFAIHRTAPGRRRALVMEIAVVVTGFFVYFGVRVLAEGSTETAVANGATIISLQESLGIYIEPHLNQAAADRAWLLTVMNWVYIWGHWPLITVSGIWLYLRHRDGYHLTRNAFLVSGLIGICLFALLPTAPPRLMDAGFVDTVTEHSYSYRLLQPPTVTNQYAAFPSLHFGWNLLVGIAIVRFARRPPVRVFGGLSPIAMLVATIFTANHYIIDVVVGGVVALIGLIAATMIARRHEAGSVLDAAGVTAEAQPDPPDADTEHAPGGRVDV